MKQRESQAVFFSIIKKDFITRKAYKIAPHFQG